MIRRTAIALAMLAAAPANAACRLSTAECSIIAEEQRTAELQLILDQRRLGHLRPAQREIEAIRMNTAYRLERSKHLPPRIALEWSRIGLCAALDQKARLDGTRNTNPQCR